MMGPITSASGELSLDQLIWVAEHPGELKKVKDALEAEVSAARAGIDRANAQAGEIVAKAEERAKTLEREAVARGQAEGDRLRAEGAALLGDARRDRDEAARLRTAGEDAQKRLGEAETAAQALRDDLAGKIAAADAERAAAVGAKAEAQALIDYYRKPPNIGKPV